MKPRTETTQPEIDAIIGKCQFCHVSMADADGNPYVVPMNFGYKDGTVYLHSSQKGKKIEILRKNPAVCIAFSTDHQLRYQNEQVACSYSMKFRSVLAYGKVEFTEDPEEKRRALEIIMRNYSPREFVFNPPSIKEVCCWSVRVVKFDCRVYGY